MKSLENSELSLSAAEFVGVMHAVLAKGCTFRFCARGASMTPFIRDGDIITIAPLECPPPRLGEVIAFSKRYQNYSNVVIHRIVSRRGRDFAVQGDGMFCEQESVALEQILGRVVSVERGGRTARFGLGPERRLLAWLSRTRLLWSLVWPVWRRVSPSFGQRKLSA